MAGRKTSAAYELYGFIPKVDNGKHSAICTSCNRVLQNTAAVRLQKHRNSCAAACASGNPAHFTNLEMKRHATPKIESIQQIENANSNVKSEQMNMEFEESNPENTYDEAIDASNQPKRLRKTIIQDEMIRTNSDLEKSTEQHEIPISAPATTQQQHQQLQQPPDPFESYTTTSAVDIDNVIEEVDDEDLINIEEELDVIQTLMPRSKESLQLQDELSRVEAEYYRNKAAYFAKLTENSKIKRTLMLLQSRKLQLEIEKLTSES